MMPRETVRTRKRKDDAARVRLLHGHTERAVVRLVTTKISPMKVLL